MLAASHILISCGAHAHGGTLKRRLARRHAQTKARSQARSYGRSRTWRHARLEVRSIGGTLTRGACSIGARSHRGLLTLLALRCPRSWGLTSSLCLSSLTELARVTAMMRAACLVPTCGGCHGGAQYFLLICNFHSSGRGSQLRGSGRALGRQLMKSEAPFPRGTLMHYAVCGKRCREGAAPAPGFKRDMSSTGLSPAEAALLPGTAQGSHARTLQSSAKLHDFHGRQYIHSNINNNNLKKYKHI
jgi:hypothetical protein